MSKNLANDLMITTSYDDPDPDGTDVDGILPLLTPYSEEDENDEAAEDNEENVAIDTAGGTEIMGASKNRAEEEELEAEIEPGFRDIDLPKNERMPDEDPEGFAALQEDLEPGEAEGYLEYMRPLTAEEAELVDDPMFKDLRWVDDPAHVQDILRTGKNERGIDNRLKDTIYGDMLMKNEEELADILDSDKLASWGDNFTPLPKTYVPTRDAKKLALVRGLSQTLQCGHARYLRAADHTAGVAIRPGSYYMNVAGLWTQNKLRRNNVPMSPRSNWARVSMPVLLGAAQTLLDETSGTRLFDAQGHADMMGWGLSSLNPIKAVKSVAKRAKGAASSIHKYTVKMPAKYAYKYTVKMPAKYAYKYGVKMPAKYAYKGAKVVGKVAQSLALRPIKAIIRKFTNTAVNRRAAAIAKQRGLPKPGPAERTAALTWAKNLVRKTNRLYGSAIASLMGAEHGVQAADISLGNADNATIGNDVMGTAGLIMLGPIALISLLTKLFKTKSAQQAAPPLPGEDPNAEDLGTPDEGYEEDASEESYAEESYPEESYPEDSAGGPSRGGIGKRVAATLLRNFPNGIPRARLAQLRLISAAVAKALIQAGKLKVIG